MIHKIASHPLMPERFRSDAALPGRLAAVSECLMETNKKFNLTAITDPDEIVAKHIMDSLVAADAVAAAVGEGKASLIDVGSGAGFPALPIAAAVPAVSVTALDSTAKKCNYISETAAAAGIPGLVSLCGRAEEIARDPARRDSYDFATARAVANLPVLLELCLPFVKVGGVFFALKGSHAPEEIAASRRAFEKLGASLESVSEYRIPGDDAPRYLLTVRKLSPTKEAYPRHYSQISKKPL